MSRTVFAVESGDYSDYVLHALFEMRELAQEYLDTLVAAAMADEREHWAGSAEDVEAEGNSVRARLSITSYQLWDALPVVSPGALYEQNHTEPDLG